MIIVNLKTYDQALGNKALKLARDCTKVSRDTNVRIVVAPQAVDLRSTAGLGAEVFAQHVDDASCGKFTGWITPEAIRDAGAKGVILNHSEHQLEYAKLKRIVERCKQLGLETCVCADTIEAGEKLRALSPTYIAVEPPELIGGDISVSSARPELIEEAVRRVHTPATRVLVGAGIKTGEDVRVALRLGAEGILVASGVVKAGHPEQVLLEFADAFNE